MCMSKRDGSVSDVALDATNEKYLLDVPNKQIG